MRSTPSRCITERHAGAFTIVPEPWADEDDGEADRWLVRRCATCRHLDVVSLIEVDPHFMVCLCCLSQDVDLDESSTPLSCVCNECGRRSPIDVEEMERRAKSLREEPDEDEADDGDGWSDPSS
jgi:hypothetical protein